MKIVTGNESTTEVMSTVPYIFDAAEHNSSVGLGWL
jgi:hypothetical protein